MTDQDTPRPVVDPPWLIDPELAHRPYLFAHADEDMEAGTLVTWTSVRLLGLHPVASSISSAWTGTVRKYANGETPLGVTQLAAKRGETVAVWHEFRGSVLSSSTGFAILGPRYEMAALRARAERAEQRCMQLAGEVNLEGTIGATWYGLHGRWQLHSCPPPLSNPTRDEAVAALNRIRALAVDGLEHWDQVSRPIAERYAMILTEASRWPRVK